MSNNYCSSMIKLLSHPLQHNLKRRDCPARSLKWRYPLATFHGLIPKSPEVRPNVARIYLGAPMYPNLGVSKPFSLSKTLFVVSKEILPALHFCVHLLTSCATTATWRFICHFQKVPSRGSLGIYCTCFYMSLTISPMLSKKSLTTIMDKQMHKEMDTQYT